MNRSLSHNQLQVTVFYHRVFIIFTHMSTNIHTDGHIHTCPQRFTHIHKHSHMSTNIHANAHKHAFTHVHKHSLKHSHRCPQAQSFTQKFTHMYTIHTNVHKLSNTCTQTGKTWLCRIIQIDTAVHNTSMFLPLKHLTLDDVPVALDTH